LCLSLAELVLFTVIIGFMGWKNLLFFGPVMILWINVVTDTLPALALGTLKAEKGIMNRGPNVTRGSLFKGRTGLSLLVYSLMMTAIVGSVYATGRFVFELSHESVITKCYLAFVIIEGVHAFNLVSETKTIFSRDTFKSKWMNWAVIGSLIIGLFPILVPGVFQDVLGLTTLEPMEWLVGIGIGLLMIPMVEIYKFVLRKSKKV